MRLSEWRAASPSKDAASAKIAAIVDPVLAALGAGPDPEAFVVWGEEPGIRYSIFVPSPAGLIIAYVRVSVPGEGPRATAKLIRWSRVQLGELSLETQGEHRLVSFQVEGQVLNGADANADRIARFALELLAAVDGRVLPPEAVAKRGAARAPKASLTASSRTSPAPAAAKKLPAGAPKKGGSAKPGTAVAVVRRSSLQG
jgi:hypothetical protein